MDKNMRLRSLFVDPYTLLRERDSVLFLSPTNEAARRAMKMYIDEKQCKERRTIVIDEGSNPFEEQLEHAIFFDKLLLSKQSETKTKAFVYPIFRMQPDMVFYVDVSEEELHDSFQLAATGHTCIFSYAERSVLSFLTMMKERNRFAHWRKHLDVFDRYVEINDTGEITGIYSMEVKSQNLQCLYCI